jgi:hypothetical protein
MNPNQKLMIGQGEPLEHQKMYRRMARKLNYLATSPDISFAMSVACQFLKSQECQIWLQFNIFLDI